MNVENTIVTQNATKLSISAVQFSLFAAKSSLLTKKPSLSAAQFLDRQKNFSASRVTSFMGSKLIL